MPIKIPNDLPARPILENEHIFVMTETRAGDDNTVVIFAFDVLKSAIKSRKVFFRGVFGGVALGVNQIHLNL